MTALCNGVLQGDALTILQSLPGESVQCVVTSPPYFKLRSYLSGGAAEKTQEIGSEETPQAYIMHLVAVFHEVYRVLKPDGICWINMADSYSSEKRLLGLPWRLVFALEEGDGWLLRQEVIWEKTNVLPEPVEDRCTKAHESVFLLTRQPRYFYNANAIREPHATGMQHIGSTWPTRKAQGSPTRYGSETAHLAQQARDWMGKHPLGRNKRSVWHIPTEKSSGGHYATMPRKLAEVCILAGSRPGDVVLDPFCGTGTTLLVAAQHHRRYLGIELSQDYCSLVSHRLAIIQTHLWEAVSNEEGGDALSR